MADQCRPEVVRVDGEDVPVLVKGSGPLTEAGKAALAEVVAASMSAMAADPRHRAIGVLMDHLADSAGVCACGRRVRHLRVYAVHLVDQLVEAGLIVSEVDRG